mmetsp:Transcript_22643/g.89577  ORF Transcript_22643/g.89577 Transcript_22643/m.89577 type:complete len:1056 (-) Transcript_22643:76-3243(-)
MGKKGDSEKELSAQDEKFLASFFHSRKDEAIFSGWVRLMKGKKMDDRLFAVGSSRIFSFTSKHKVDKEAHILEIKGIESKVDTEVAFAMDSGAMVLVSPKVDHIINTVRLAYSQCFPGSTVDEALKVSVEPDSRLKDLDDDAMSVCGGFSETYKAMCDFYQTPVREDICWDITHLFPANNITEFNVEDLEQPVSALELAGLIGAMRFNKYFTGFVARHIQLDAKRTFQDIGAMLKGNTTINKLVLCNVGMNKDAGMAVADGLKANSNTGVNILDLSKNPIDDKTMNQFAQWLGAMKHGMISMDFSNCNIGKGGMVPFVQSFRRNIHMQATLQTLTIRGNTLDAEGSSALASWLANPNKLQVLHIGTTSANLETIMPAIVRGCQEIRSIDVSSNKFGAKSTQSLSTFLQSTATLTNLSLRGTQLDVNGVKSIIKAIGGNMYLNEFTLNIAENKFGVAGARALAEVVPTAKNIVDLDLSDNDFGDDGVVALCEGLGKHTDLKTLRFSRNFSPKPGKQRQTAIEGLITLINDESPITHLYLQGNKANSLKLDILDFLDGVGSNETLLFLDISGQAMGNKGAIALGKAIQTNHKLEHLVFDENGTGLPGLVAVASGMQRNRSLKQMRLPIIDISAIPKSEPRLLKTLDLIQATLARNQNPKSTLGQGGAGGFSQLAFLSSGEREHVERLRLKIKSQNRKLTEDQKLTVTDADSNDNYLSSIHGLVEAHQLEMAAEIREKLKELAGDIMPVVDNHFQNMVGGILETVKSNYTSLDQDSVRRINTSIQFGTEHLESSAVETILASAASAEIARQANKAFGSALEIVTDYIFEKLGDSLQAIVEDVHMEPQRQSVAIFDASKELEKVEAEEKKKAPPAVAPRDKSPMPGRKVPPPVAPRAGASPARGRGRGLASTLPAGFDPTRMLGAGRGGFAPPPRNVAPDPPSGEEEPEKEPEKGEAERKDSDKKDPKKKGGLFGRKSKDSKGKSPKPPSRKTAKGAPPTTVKKVKKPSGETSNIKAIDVAVKEADKTPELTHHTRDRPMVQRKRKPPTRRPRNRPAAA